MLSLSAAAYAQIGIGISVRFGPPALPVYEQPLCPGAGYLWTPGYWAWSDDDGYYWVPGTWVEAPVGLLWTPGYWGWEEGAFFWHDGYWGPTVGFYGGINYGFGYTGEGFYGGEWRGRSFYYNGAVMNVRGAHITNVYERTVVVNNNHVAYNGGEGGLRARPTAEQERFAREHHTAAVAAQRQQARDASRNRALFARENHGRPAIAATARPGDFKGHVVAAREAGAAYQEPKMSPREARVKANAEKPNAARQEANQRKSEQKNAERQQAEQRKTEQKNAERQQAEQRKAEQKNAERQQAQQQKSEQKNAERQQAQQQKAEQKNAQRQQAQQQKAEQKNAQRQQAQQQKAEQKQAQREQKQSKPQRTAQKPGKEEKGPGR